MRARSMKKFMGITVIITTVILFFYSNIIAQDQSNPIEITLSVENNVIKVVDDTCFVDSAGSYIKFTTRQNNITFVVVIDNYDGFFETPVNPLIIMVTRRNPAIFQIGTPPDGDTVKFYSVGVQTAADAVPPLPPEAPPRIILRTN